jgi:hypothetical protein
VLRHHDKVELIALCSDWNGIWMMPSGKEKCARGRPHLAIFKHRTVIPVDACVPKCLKKTGSGSPEFPNRVEFGTKKSAQTIVVFLR